MRASAPVHRAARRGRGARPTCGAIASACLAALACGVGCGRVGFDGQALDAPALDAPTPDAALGPFHAPAPIVELDSAQEDDDPTLTADQLEIYFASNRAGGQGGDDIWHSTRASVADPWGPPGDVVDLDSAASEITPELAPDGLTIFFARDVGAGGGHDIYVATRPDRASAWSAPVRVAELSSGNDDSAAAPDADLHTIVLTRGSVTADARLYIATRAATTDAWSAPDDIPKLDPAAITENQAWLGANAIYFTVNVPGEQALRRAPRTGPTTFGAAETIPELDLPGSESDPWLSDDQRTIYFEHEDDLYVAHR